MNKEVVKISDMGASSGGNFRGNRYCLGSISSYFHILFTSRSVQNSLVKAFV